MLIRKHEANTNFTEKKVKSKEHKCKFLKSAHSRAEKTNVIGCIMGSVFIDSILCSMCNQP